MGEMQRCTSRYVGMCVIILSTRCMSKKGMKQIKPTARRIVFGLRAHCRGCCGCQGAASRNQACHQTFLPTAAAHRRLLLGPARVCPFSAARSTNSCTITGVRPAKGAMGQEGASARHSAGAKWRAGRTVPMRWHQGGREQPGRGTAGCAAMQLRHETAIAFPSARGHASRAAQTPRQAASMRRRRAGAPADPRGKNPSAHVDRRAHSLRNCDRFGQNGPPGPRCCRSSDVLSCTPQPLEPRVEIKSSAPTRNLKGGTGKETETGGPRGCAGGQRTCTAHPGLAFRRAVPPSDRDRRARRSDWKTARETLRRRAGSRHGRGSPVVCSEFLT